MPNSLLSKLIPLVFVASLTGCDLGKQLESNLTGGQVLDEFSASLARSGLLEMIGSGSSVPSKVESSEAAVVRGAPQRTTLRMEPKITRRPDPVPVDPAGYGTIEVSARDPRCESAPHAGSHARASRTKVGEDPAETVVRDFRANGMLPKDNTLKEGLRWIAQPATDSFKAAMQKRNKVRK